MLAHCDRNFNMTYLHGVSVQWGDACWTVDGPGDPRAILNSYAPDLADIAEVMAVEASLAGDYRRFSDMVKFIEA